MSSTVIPDENVEPDFDLNQGVSETTPGIGQTDFQRGKKTLRGAVKQGAGLAIKRKLYIDRIASKVGGDKDRARSTAQRDYSKLIRETSFKIQSQNPELSIQEAKLQAEEEVLSKPNYINLIAGNKFANAATKKTKQVAIAAAQKTALAIPIIGVVLSFLIGKEWFRKYGAIVLGLMCCCCCLMWLFIFSKLQSITSDAQSAFEESAQLISCAGLPADIQKPTSEEAFKIFSCAFEQKNQEYSSSDPIPE